MKKFDKGYENMIKDINEDSNFRCNHKIPLSIWVAQFLLFSLLIGTILASVSFLKIAMQ